MMAHERAVVRRLMVAGAASFAIAAGSLFALSAQAPQVAPAAPAAAGEQAGCAPPGGRQGAGPPGTAGAARAGGAGRGGGVGAGTQVYGPGGNADSWGFTNSAFNPQSRWRIHDPERPQPPVVTPGETVSIPAPSDAIVLFDGKDLSKWVSRQNGVDCPPTWTVHDGYFEATGGNLSTRDSFGDVQLHVEFAIPDPSTGVSQGKGNGGVTFMGRYEIQILDSSNNRTYADGMMASIYGEYPPMVNVARKPGEWQSIDIIFEAPKFNGQVTPGYFTILWNGVIVHNRTQLWGTTTPIMTPHVYAPHEAELPLSLQGRARVRYRNVWIRRLQGYDVGARIN